MARRIKCKLDTRGTRLKLPVAKKPTFAKIGPRVGLGYRRNKTAGTWVARVADGRGGNWTKAIGIADDFEDANGATVLDFWQAQERARALARGGRDGKADDGKLTTVELSLDRYKTDLEARNGDVNNVARVKGHLPEALAKKHVAFLTAKELRAWRNGLTERLAPATINRTTTVLKAALNLAADHDERIVSRVAWETGLAAIHDVDEPRNVILTESTVHALIAAAYEVRTEFGLLVEIAAVTGARVSQLARLEVQDVQGDRADPRVMMPTSHKGRGQKKIMRRPVPISANLLTRLRVAMTNRPGNAPLLMKPSGEPWKQSDHTRLFQRTAIRAGEDPSTVTLYALRHTNIVRQLLAGVPIRVVAVNHDTSVQMIEKTYSRYIGDHADALARRGLLETSAPPTIDNVVPIGAARDAS